MTGDLDKDVRRGWTVDLNTAPAGFPEGLDGIREEGEGSEITAIFFP